jgi:hypothetical protein
MPSSSKRSACPTVSPESPLTIDKPAFTHCLPTPPKNFCVYYSAMLVKPSVAAVTTATPKKQPIILKADFKTITASL